MKISRALQISERDRGKLSPWSQISHYRTNLVACMAPRNNFKSCSVDYIETCALNKMNTTRIQAMKTRREDSRTRRRRLRRRERRVRQLTVSTHVTRQGSVEAFKRFRNSSFQADLSCHTSALHIHKSSSGKNSKFQQEHQKAKATHKGLSMTDCIGKKILENCVEQKFIAEINLMSNKFYIPQINVQRLFSV
ncbi:uncharacterized protein LOC116840739 isoform X2 [Odontomachus brunneus]|uniref:uncharacterized protein LOC116840739 isoform X2 n=1 Tax=Odontomachus brunneus TaxID=486640 RepID=UPI0013F1DE6A|nr:uncharacterized protein LOC116840739 isoform X2 [Odontomachus brunneus]